MWFDLSVAEHVLSEPGFLGVGFAALCASKRPIGAVHISTVRVQHRLGIERLRAVIAWKWPFSVV